VTFYIPLGALGRAVPQARAYPFDEHSGSESLEWRTPIDTWLAGDARQMFTTARSAGHRGVRVVPLD
jgi:hypothetical protein